MAEGAATKEKHTTWDQTSYQASANAEIWPYPQKLPWSLFVKDSIKEYEKDMALIGHEPAPAPPLPQSEIDNFADMEESLKNQWSWFLKQNEELLKLLDSLHRQEYNDIVHQEEEILDKISDFTLVLFEYVKTLKKRKRKGAWCV